ncbi:4Fe-4S dicluster domain-containing protein [Desulfacinum hydrothermale DSM 13146]|uniref:4Fe-4S dicluster domain-containing protein n=1 Tax=Desulfacinum hydrothermale DSM 13146 TaxID=1121390 RepID=A0A1W1WY98_9BACT|nr:4Fe-4S dicluster domain-containing protein [Desulfacinum hydrothermale]SMC16624.1 4Fe-4S dicluster domain-containing protein [Desulfacinum hydrothermale DSM 13146]
MKTVVVPSAADRKSINQAIRAEINLCYTCGSCASECPINRATNRLHPRVLVWMANLGLIEELVELPEIWFCLACRRCSNACPMTVKPAMLIAHLRWEAVRRGVVSPQVALQWRELQARLHEERHHVLARLASGETSTGQDVGGEGSMVSDRGLGESASFFDGYPTHLTSCFACGECSSACPVCHDRKIFDPLFLFRSALLGDPSSLLQSPALWLCVQCQSCTEACSQGVRGHLVIRRLRQLAEGQGWISTGLLEQWRQEDRRLLLAHVECVEDLLQRR